VPPGTQITPYFDETSTIRNSVDDVQITLLISLAMVILTMAVFLRRLAPTLIATSAVPMSLCGAFIVMYAMDYTLDNLSLLALVIALTFVVDDAIVVIENIIRHLDEGKPRLQAALEGAKEIGFTIVAITASLLVLLAFTIYLFHVLPGTDFPPQDTGLIWGRASGEVTMSFADLEARTQALVTMLRKDPAVEYVGASVGTSRRGPSGWFSIQLKPQGKERRDTTDQVVARLSAKVSRYPDLDVRFRALQDLGGGGGGTSQGGQYSVALQSNSATELEEWLPKLQAQ